MIERPSHSERLSDGEPMDPLEWYYHHARYLFACHHTFGRDVLDIACGTGYGSELMKLFGARTVTGVDASAEALIEAHERHAQPGVTFLRGDALDPPVLGPFGAVVSIETIEHLADPEAALNAYAALLTDDGVFVCSTPDREGYRPGSTRDQRPDNPFHVAELSRDELRAALEERFSKVQIYRQRCLLPGRRLPSKKISRVAAAIERATGWPTPLPLRSLYVVAVCHRVRR